MSAVVLPDFAAFLDWLDAQAEAIDTDATLASALLPRLGASGVLRVGVPPAHGGLGGTASEAIEVLATVAEHSLAAAFVFWGQRAFIEYLLQSPNAALAQRWLPALLNGDLAGATGLSNAMKYLSDIEPLSMHAERREAHWHLHGSLPWITNLRPEGFLAAAAFDRADGMPAAIFAVPHDAPGVTRSADLDLIALRASNTAALRLDDTRLDDSWLISADAPHWLAEVRPAFLGLQCGMSIGLARRALQQVETAGPGSRAALAAEAASLGARLEELAGVLLAGVQDGRFRGQPAAMFELRIELAAVVAAAVGLEVQASGGRGYLRGQCGTARRAREAAFVPIITPSLVQLKQQLARHRAQAEA